jgi:aryl-alcohol dehydrogenase-like predicted oxidoreductase
MVTDPASDRRSRIVFGTFALPDTAVAPRLLDRFHAAGGRALDVANVYLDGEAARAAGRWLARRGPAAGVIVYAKGCHPPACRPELVRAEVENALRLLGLDHADVFLLHRDDQGVDVTAWADALQAQVAAGRIGAFGVSNWTLARTSELAAAVARNASDGLVAFSNHFSLAELVSEPWPDCLAVAQAQLPELGAMGLRVLAWSSLATGYFAGHERPSWSSPGNAARRERAREIASRRGVSPTAIALAYVLHQPGHVLPVIGTVSTDHLAEAFGAAALELTPAEAAWLERGEALSLPSGP